VSLNARAAAEMSTPIEAYPLCWPASRARTKRRDDSRLRASFAAARNAIVREVRLLGGMSLIVSTNIELRRDGLPYAATREPEDGGVAVYFAYKQRQMCFACDRWRKVAANMQAIAKTIEALRGVARWGTGDMMEAAFTGFAALPAPGQETRPWADVLGVSHSATRDEIESAYRRMRSKHHPDKGGKAEQFNAVQKAYELAMETTA